MKQNRGVGFYEALQSIWLVHIMLQNEAWGPGLSFGRVDQYLYPFLKRDLVDGTLTAAEARDLAALFLIKANDVASVASSMNIET
jgi:pyruvate-formate lyase